MFIGMILAVPHGVRMVRVHESDYAGQLYSPGDIVKCSTYHGLGRLVRVRRPLDGTIDTHVQDFVYDGIRWARAFFGIEGVDSYDPRCLRSGQ